MDDVALLHQFKLNRVLNHDAAIGYIVLLGSLPSSSGEVVTSIVRIQRSNELPAEKADRILSILVEKAELVEKNDIYSWMRGWLVQSPELPDLKIDIISPATGVHIRKYERQQLFLIHETPHLYQTVTKTYIDSFDPARTEWVRNILSGASEANKVLYASENWVVLPDMKWDPEKSSMDKLYLVAITRHEHLKSLRDLNRTHLPILQELKHAVESVVTKYGLEPNTLRMFLHYQPSYYHLHVHIVNINHYGLPGMVVGQAHLLENVMSMLELDSEIFMKMTLTYGLGEKHGLYQLMRTRTKPLSE